MKIKMLFFLSFVSLCISAQCPDGKHPHMIDLGLPSGTQWACCNIGADKPEDYGNYYAWGETEPKTTYTEQNYSFDRIPNIGNNHNISGTEYDVATVKWNSNWCMPSEEQMQELINCTNHIELKNGIKGLIVDGYNGNMIFIPFAAKKSDSSSKSYSGAYYWTSNQVYKDYSGEWDNEAIILKYDETDENAVAEINDERLFRGLTVRAVANSDVAKIKGIAHVKSDGKPYTISVNNGILTINASDFNNTLSWNVYGLDANCINSGTTKNKTINISNLKPGVQIVKISIDRNSWYEKVIKY